MVLTSYFTVPLEQVVLTPAVVIDGFNPCSGNLNHKEHQSFPEYSIAYLAIYFPNTSNSKFTVIPAFKCLKVVCS